MTNHEKIRNMSTEELAGMLGRVLECCEYYDCDACYFAECKDVYKCTSYGIKQWLESEAEE